MAWAEAEIHFKERDKEEEEEAKEREIGNRNRFITTLLWRNPPSVCLESCDTQWEFTSYQEMLIFNVLSRWDNHSEQ